jgi:cytochrome c-type biogenesis protein CcmH/NrfG
MTLVWMLFALMALGVVLFLAPPFFSEITPEEDAELESYFAQIDTIKANEDIDPLDASEAVAGLQRQILDKQEGQSARSPSAFNGIILLMIAVIGGGVYFTQARPDLIDIDESAGILEPAQALAQAEPPEHDRGTQLADLVEQLELRLSDERAEDPNGWLLYARSLMNLGRFEEAITAYDKVVLLTGGNPDALDERARAQAFIEQRSGEVPPSPPIIDARPQRGPTDADVRDAQSMSDGDRQVMIQGMVDGLAARLEDSPNDASGWARLIRARMVLGQRDEAAANVAAMRRIFENEPETVQQILDSVGWDD